jgi:hypothetical protein
MTASLGSEAAGQVQRVLDLDLDFFLDGAACFRSPDAPRLDGQEFPPWGLAEVLDFLEKQCHLDGPLPGFAVEHHREHFPHWRDAIDRGLLQPPFHVTHVDAHADLGQGEISYEYLMTQLLYESPENRRHPLEGPDGLDDGSYLAFSIACRWISDLVYVFNEGGGNDALYLFKEGFDWNANQIQLAAMSKSDLDLLTGIRGPKGEPKIDRLEPPVPFTEVRWPDFQCGDAFDFVCLARSPAFTPSEADLLFDEIRGRFIDESIWAAFV